MKFCTFCFFTSSSVYLLVEQRFKSPDRFLSVGLASPVDSPHNQRNWAMFLFNRNTP